MFKESNLNNKKKFIFQSERCYVRSFVEYDLDDFLSYRNNLEWMKFQGFKGLSRKEYEEALLKKPSFEKGAQFAILRKVDQHLIGDVFIKMEDDTFWIGYTVSPLYKRQGYAYEIAKSMIIWMKQQGEYKIKAGVEPKNISSIRLLEKLGFLLLTEEDGELIYLFHQAQ
ncbi:GNAT family N-acetyltransferase [Gudongella sp. DL1XJH-153]|uniref:GNAT family N-acetyltransferase n=1 Tax=Gudongella sp. DL1XJH-153 TaxID=3409804 RepID=UPI003BB48DE4